MAPCFRPTGFAITVVVYWQLLAAAIVSVASQVPPDIAFRIRAGSDSFSPVNGDETRESLSDRGLAHGPPGVEWNDSIVKKLCGSIDGKSSDEQTLKDQVFVAVVHELFDTSHGLVLDIPYTVRIQTGDSTGHIYVLETTSPYTVLEQRVSPEQISCETSYATHRLIFLGKNLSVSFKVTTLPSSGRVHFRVASFSTTLNRIVSSATVSYNVTADCSLRVATSHGLLLRGHLPTANKAQCTVFFPGVSRSSIHLSLRKLKLPCPQRLEWTTQRDGMVRRKFCGKLHDYAKNQREWQIYEESVYLQLNVWSPHSTAFFAVKFARRKLCERVVLNRPPNGPLRLNPAEMVQGQCGFEVQFPYGYKVELWIHTDETSQTSHNEEASSDHSVAFNNEPLTSHENKGCPCCFLAQVEHSGGSQTLCLERIVNVTVPAQSNHLQFRASFFNSCAFDISVDVHAVGLSSETDGCDFGWVPIDNATCVSASDHQQLSWEESETVCRRYGGHLVTINEQHAQDFIENLITNSGYHDDPNQGFWIGASDQQKESVFQWSSGKPFLYSKWFGGWPHLNHYNIQPNDDGFSSEDCVEMRQWFRETGQKWVSTARFFWNDRHCSVPNYFVCEKPRVPDVTKVLDRGECNTSIQLNRQRTWALIGSPNYPLMYPESARCTVSISAPIDYLIVLHFQHFDLEDDEDCVYDYVEITESFNASRWKRCGNWNSRLKLLHTRSTSNKLEVHFSSDSTYSGSGFQLTATLERNRISCPESRSLPHNGYCYLIVPYPEVKWETANQICQSFQGELVYLDGLADSAYLTRLLTPDEFNSTPFYWIARESLLKFQLILSDTKNETELCPAFHTIEMRENETWEPCNSTAGYICRRSLKNDPVVRNFSVQHSHGEIKSPNYPGAYPENLELMVRISVPRKTVTKRLILEILDIDVEYQENCLYDYVGLRLSEKGPITKLCGNHLQNDRLKYVAEANEIWLTFRSDYSLADKGFHAVWNTTDFEGCPRKEYTNPSGVVRTPNLSSAYLSNLECNYDISAPGGMKVLVEFQNFHVGRPPCKEDFVRIWDGVEDATFCGMHNLTRQRLRFVSQAGKLSIHLKTGNGKEERLFYATYRFVEDGEPIRETVTVSPGVSFLLTPLNYPMKLPATILHDVFLITRPGYNLRLRGLSASPSDPLNASVHETNLRITDFYESLHANQSDNDVWWNQTNSHLEVISYFNSIRATYLYNSTTTSHIAIFVEAVEDARFVSKLRAAGESKTVESCEIDLCENGAICSQVNGTHYCNCTHDWRGLFCTVSLCDWTPCVHGTCYVQNASQVCVCEPGFTGQLCETAVLPCDADPCQGHGDCVNVGSGFQCNCHAWWQGPQCETRWFHIPYKPLSQRMLEEPFWLGLITIAAVLVLIALVWCVRRHFPEKIGKLVTDDLERGKLVDQSPGDWPRHRSSFRRNSLEPMLNTNSNTTHLQNNGGSAEPTPNSKTFMSRLGLRKPSLLSITSLLSPNQAGTSCDKDNRTRTFSLDDLFRMPKRSPSPGKTRASDVDVASKQRETERHQLLKRLIAPRFGNFDFGQDSELGNNTQQALPHFLSSENGQSTDNEAIAETSFTTRMEKRVTFARMLSRVSTEISSSASDLSGLEEASMKGSKHAGVFRLQHRRRGRGWNGRKLWKLPHSNSSTQGSASDLDIADRDLSSTDSVAAPLSERNSLRLLKLPPRPSKGKVTNSDPVKTLLRNFSSKSLSTPSSPQGSDADASSPNPTPLSTPGTPVHSTEPVNQVNSDATIQVTVLDPVNSHRNSRTSPTGGPFITLEIPNQNYGRFLSPIHEVPTPLPSPAHTCMTQARSHSNPTKTKSSEDETSTDSSRTSPSVRIILTEDDDASETNSTFQKAVEDVTHKPASPRQKPPPLKILNSNFKRFENMESTFIAQPKLEFPVLPVLCVSEPSPQEECVQARKSGLTEESQPKNDLPSWGCVTIGSPPSRKQADYIPLSNEACTRRILKNITDKSSSLDLPNAPPMITVTANFSEAESDTENTRGGGDVLSGQNTMCYLSPYVCFAARTDIAASESNLSSSGYSSMASPGPSPCVSSKTLCCSESDEIALPGRRRFRERQLFRRALSPSLESSSPPLDSPKKFALEIRMPPSDSEVTDDQLIIEPTDPESTHEDSVDEGLGIDHIRKKIDDGEVRSAKELECFIASSSATELHAVNNIKVQKSRSLDSKGSTQAIWAKVKSDSLDTKIMSQMMPAIIQRPLQKLDHLSAPRFEFSINEEVEKKRSPVSSRSESPLSDAKSAGLSRFSSQFYGKSRIDLPYTDSDGLYDYPSSESKLPLSVVIRRNLRKSERRRERKAVFCVVRPDGNNASSISKCASLLDPAIDRWRLVTPKRRHRTQSNISSSSSSCDSITLSEKKTPRRRAARTKPVKLDYDPSPSCDVVLTIQGATSAEDSTSEGCVHAAGNLESCVTSEIQRVTKPRNRKRFQRPWRKHESYRRMREQLSQTTRMKSEMPKNSCGETLTRQDSSSSCLTDSDARASNDSLANLAEPEDSPESPKDPLM